ncbi:6-phosphogluconolactonase [Kribbella sp. NPDC050124]|uniref:6-phosphogluconolactonase n=1 Tax=Kribbella sp. NPDC050124 TaxID=3364114 RepID=UPI0037A4183C
MNVETWPDPAALGTAAAAAAAESLRRTIDERGTARLVLAAAPSQLHTLAALAVAEGIDWRRVEVFHMDEYVGLPPDAEQRFGQWLRRHFVNQVPPTDQLRSTDRVLSSERVGRADQVGSGGRVGSGDQVGSGDRVRLAVIDPEGGAEPGAEAARYARLVSAAPIDIVLAGIGVNGHLAFNDPPADFSTTDVVQVVALDNTSRRQQVDEGLFGALDDVPTHAWTLTVPFLLSAREIFCMVSGPAKREAVRRTLAGPVDPAVPATALHTHPRTRLFLDLEANPDE